MEDAVIVAGEIEMVGREQVAGAEPADVGPLAGGERGEGEGVVGGGVGGHRHLAPVDAVLVRLFEQETAIGIVADEGDRRDRHVQIELPDRDRHVATGAAAAHLGREDVSAAVLVRPAVEQEVAVDAPGAAGENSLARHGSATTSERDERFRLA